MGSLDRREFLAAGTGALSALVATSLAGEVFAFSGETEKVKAAFVGVGRQGRVLLGELTKFPFVEVVAICDSSSGRLRSARRRARDARTYEDYRELLDKEKEVNAVFVCTPTHVHREIAVAALESGRHVFCEAPMASTVEDCKAIAAASAKSDRVFHVGLQLRSNPIYKLAREFYRSFAIRDLVSLTGLYRSKTSWRIPAPDASRERALNWRLFKDISIGLPGEVGTHQFDVISWFTGKLPESVMGMGATRLHRDGREMPDTVHCLMRWPDDVQMSYEATLGSSYGGRYEELVGTMGSFKLIGDFGWLFKEADAPTQGWEVYAVRQNFHKEEGITLIADATKLAKQGKLKDGVGLPHPPVYYGIGAFLDSVTKERPSLCPASLGLRSAVLGIKANEAVMERKEIRFEDDWFKV